MTKMRKHQEQYERMKRWYERIKKIDQGRPHNLPSDYYCDEVYAFFVNCYHLKDWIINDDTVKKSEKGEKGGKVEDFINQNGCMRICADICNGIKHVKKSKDPRKPPRSDEDPEFGARKLSLNLGGGPEPVITVKFSIETKTGTIDAFELASECVRKWEEFIKDNINRPNGNDKLMEVIN